MKLGSWTVGAAAIVFAAGCSNAPKPMTDAERAALADSISQMATQMYANLEQNLSADNVLSYFVRGNNLVIVENGKIYPTYDSIVKEVRASYRPGAKVTATLGQRRVTVLSRDAVALTGIINGTMREDSAGPEIQYHDLAWTGVYTRTPDGWKIVLEHSSMPPAPAPAKPARRN